MTSARRGTLLARGLLHRLRTGADLPDAPGLADDPLLGAVEADRRATLVATRRSAAGLELDVRLQGEGERVFLRDPVAGD